MQKTKPVFWIILLASIIVLIPHLFIPIINYGQLGKQTFAAEMIRSIVNGEVAHGIFPIRHFLESNHNDLIPWAEEFPLYDWIVAGLAWLTHVNLIILAKFVNLIAFGFLILGFFKIGKFFQEKDESYTPWIFAAVAAAYPAFRLYSVEVMPDLCMTAACVWAIERAFKGHAKSSALFIAVASLFKYYAVFTGFGIGLYYLYQFYLVKKPKPLLHAFWFILAIVPCVIYIAYFIHLQIPNPITEYRAADGHGHLSSLHGLLQFKKWGRAFLWVFVKNSTLLATAFAAVGLYQYRKSVHPLLVTLIIGWIIFPIVFIESFYVHDYYGLQASIGVAIFAALGLDSLRRNEKMVLAGMYLLILWSIIHVRGMNRPIRDFDQIQFQYQKIVKELGYTPKWGFVFSGISKPVIPYLLELNSWVASFEEASQPVTIERLKDPRIDVVFVHQFSSMDDELPAIEALIEQTHLYQKAYDQKYSESRLLVYKRFSKEVSSH